MATHYYCVKRPGECDGTCDICPQPPQQLEFDWGMDVGQEDIQEREDLVNKPDHYTLGKIEVYDFIKAWDLDFAEGNVVKYTVRAPYKGNTLQDLKKARWYLDREISKYEG